MSDVAKGKIKDANVAERLNLLQGIADSMVTKVSPDDEKLPPLNNLQQRAREQVDDTGLITYSQGTGPIRIRPRGNHERQGPYERPRQLYPIMTSNRCPQPLYGPPLMPSQPQHIHNMRGPQPNMAGPQNYHDFHLGFGGQRGPNFQVNSQLFPQTQNPMENNHMFGPNPGHGPRPQWGQHFQNLRGPMNHTGEPRPYFNNFDMRDIDFNHQINNYNNQNFQSHPSNQYH